MSIPVAQAWRQDFVRFRPNRPGHSIVEEVETQVLLLSKHSLRLPDRVLAALDASLSDFRTVQSLASELGVSEASVREAITSLGIKVRRPRRPRPSEVDWVRLSSRGNTWGERARIVLSALGRVDYR